MDEKGANTFPFHNLPPEPTKTSQRSFLYEALELAGFERYTSSMVIMAYGLLARKLPLTVLIRAMGISSDSDIIDMFGQSDTLQFTYSSSQTSRSNLYTHCQS